MANEYSIHTDTEGGFSLYHEEEERHVSYISVEVVLTKGGEFEATVPGDLYRGATAIEILQELSSMNPEFARFRIIKN